MGAGRITRPGGPRVGDPWCRPTCHEEGGSRFLQSGKMFLPDHKALYT